jgi:hypothetical protein
MHDGQVEERLRTVLRAEGDHLPMTISSADLERRLLLRRRRTRGRWVSLVAAAAAVVAIVGIAALGNGWLAPAVGTQVSPSPSIGLSRIERDTQGRLVLEIQPVASGGGVVQPLHRDLTPTDFVVSVKVLCLGDGSLSFTDRTHIKELACTKADTLDPVFQPDPILVPVIDGSFDTVLTVPPGIRYTMLVETVPVPDHMPNLPVPDGSISMSTETAAPAPGVGSPVPGVGSGPQQEMSGRMDGPTEWVEVVCLGPGVVSYTLGPVDESTSGTTIETVCDGGPREDEIAIDFSGDQVIAVTATPTDVAFQLVATRTGPIPVAAPVVSPSIGPAVAR